MRNVLIMGAGGRDFHNFNVVYRGDPRVRVVGFTAAQIPGIDCRSYPPALAGPGYPDGIPIRPEAELAQLIRAEDVDEVVLAYSDLPHVEVMHKASAVLAAGADFTLLGPARTMLASKRPVVAVCATRTGAGKSSTSRHVAELLVGAGLRPVLVRHPMPYGDLVAMAVQRFATLGDIDAAQPTIEEREEYEEPVRRGLVMYAGVDYGAILAQAEAEADVIIWDGGNNDFPFYRPDLWITVADPLRPVDGLAYHPGEVNLRRAAVVVINKVDSASPEQVAAALGAVASVNPAAVVVRAASPVDLDDGPALAGRRVLVVEDGPTLTHGGMSFGAGTVAARHHGAVQLLDPRPFAVGSVAEALTRYPHIGAALPAMGYSAEQLADLAASIAAAHPDVVVSGTPIDLRAALARVETGSGHAAVWDVIAAVPIRRATYRYADVGRPTLGEVVGRWAAGLVRP